MAYLQLLCNYKPSTLICLIFSAKRIDIGSIIEVPDINGEGEITIYFLLLYWPCIVIYNYQFEFFAHITWRMNFKRQRVRRRVGKYFNELLMAICKIKYFGWQV